MRWLAAILGLLRLACLRAEDNKPLVERKNRKPYLVTFYVNVDDELDSFEVMVRRRPRKRLSQCQAPALTQRRPPDARSIPSGLRSAPRGSENC